MLQTDAADGDDLRLLCNGRVLDGARVAGLYGDELDAILRGRSPTEVVPPAPGEDPHAYADRAINELLILYITRWHGGPPA